LQTAVALGAASAFALPAAAQTTLGCTTGGPGGPFPTSGSGDGSFPTTLPTFPLVSVLNVPSLPAGATCVTKIQCHSMTHTFTGDVQFVLDDPSGGRHNVFCRQGGGCDFNGDYNFVEAGGSATATCTGAALAPGDYNQNFGGYPSGTNSINNDLFSAIPAVTGNWTLSIYDWAGGDIGALTSWDICFGTPPPPPPPPPSSICISGGPGGAFPTSGSGDGTWPTIMPTFPLDSPLAVTVPAGSTKIVRVKLNGLTHTWVGDTHFVLEDPSGLKYTILHRPGFTGACCGDSCDLNGDYSIYETFGSSIVGCPGSPIPSGDYLQDFGTGAGQWPSGTNGIFDTALGSIPIMSGTWTLHVYDWAGGDVGNLTSWELCFDVPSGPTAYCTPAAPGSSSGCIPTIAATAQPNVAHSSGCVITVSNVEGQKNGIIFYGLQPNGIPWCAGGNSMLCVKAPTGRTGNQSSNGTGGACDGTLVLNWDAFQLGHPGALGQPWSAGDKAYVQGWFRDPPSCKTTFLSQALEMTYQP
jgi:subtilisin-like proprotein convertase family protein